MALKVAPKSEGYSISEVEGEYADLRKWEFHEISKIREVFSMKKCNFLPRKPPQNGFHNPQSCPSVLLKAWR